MLTSMKNALGLLLNHAVSFGCHSTRDVLVDWHCEQLEFGFGSGEGSK